MLTEYCGRSDKPWTSAEIDHKINEAVKAPQKHKAGEFARWMLRKKGLLTYSRGDVAGGPVIAYEPRGEMPARLKFDLVRLREEVRMVPEMVDEKVFVPAMVWVVMRGASKGAGQSRVNGKGRLETPFVSNQARILGQTVQGLTGRPAGQRFQRQWPWR